MVDTNISGTGFFDHCCPITPGEFLDYNILSARHLRGHLFSEVESVSFDKRVHISQPMMFHPLWLECTRHMICLVRRLPSAHQVLQVCYNSYFCQVNQDGSDEARMRASGISYHARHFIAVCKSFKIRFQYLNILDAIDEWLQPITSRKCR